MDCETALELLDEHLDGPLELSRTSALEAHLEACTPCREEAGRARRLRSELAALPSYDAPPEVIERVLAASRAPRRRRMVAGLLAAAALALAIGLVQRSQPVTPAAPGPLEVERAEREARYALALVGRAGRRVASDLKHDLLDGRVVTPMTRRLSLSLSGASREAFDDGGRERTSS